MADRKVGLNARRARLTDTAEDAIIEDRRVSLYDAVQSPDLVDGEGEPSLFDLCEHDGKERLPDLCTRVSTRLATSLEHAEAQRLRVPL